MMSRFYRISLLVALMALLSAASGNTPLYAQQTGTVVGTVTDAATAESLPGASVALRRSVDDDDVVAGAVAGSAGEYRVQNVPPGAYVLRVSYVGYRTVSVPVNVRAGATETVDVELSPTGIGLSTVVVTASRQEEQIMDAPASMTVVEARQIEREVTQNASEVLRNVAGVDLVQTGIDRRSMVLRGFNSEFSGATYTMTDYRPAAVPALTVNVYALMPIPSLDLDRIEVVRGPGSALYGAGVDAGVIHFLTKNPFTHPGTSIAVSGGERSYFSGQLRHAGVVNSRFGYKVTAAYARGDDWELGTEDVNEDGFYEGERFERLSDYEKLNLAASLSYDLTPTSTLTANVGYSTVTSVILTGVGSAQADGFGYSFGQLQYQDRGFFAQATVNRNNSGDSFLYGRVAPDGSPEPLVDNSIMVALQALQNIQLVDGRQELVFGGDFKLISPDTEGTIYGRNEDDDQIQEIGVFLQSTTAVTPMLDVVAALRGDYVNILDDVALSPRAALVFKPTPGHTMRATYNRAFAFPSARTLFLDITARQVPIAGPYQLVFQGMGPHAGFTFNDYRSTNTAAFLLPLPLPGGGTMFGMPVPVSAVPLQPVYGAFASQASDVLLSDTPLPPPLNTLTSQQRAAFAQILGSLTPFIPQAASTSGQLGIPNESDLGYRPVSGPTDIDPLKPTITHTFELGYRGLLQNRLLFAVDGYYTRKKDFIGPLLIESPLLYLASLGPDLAQTLTPIIQGAAAQDPQVAGFLQALGFTPEQAAAFLGQFAASSMSSTPIGVVQPDQDVLPETAFSTQVGGFLSYRSFGSVDLFGADIALQYLASDALVLFANASFVSDDLFDADELGEESEDLVLALNASTVKLKGGFDYSFRNGLSLGASGRHIKGFPVRSGPYEGEIDSYFLLDVSAGYEFGRTVPGLRVDVTVQNVLDNVHREFIGAPEIGRMGMARLLYSF